MMLANGSAAGSLLLQAAPALSLLPGLFQSGRVAVPELKRGYSTIPSGSSVTRR